MSLPKGVCVKVDYLRPNYSNLRDWLNAKGHVLVTRPGRIFIDKHIFHYPGSPWANPFKIKDYGLNQCLELYKKHLDKLLLDPNKLEEFKELKNATELGCFCKPDENCHRNIIIEKLKTV